MPGTPPHHLPVLQAPAPSPLCHEAAPPQSPNPGQVGTHSSLDPKAQATCPPSWNWLPWSPRPSPRDQVPPKTPTHSFPRCPQNTCQCFHARPCFLPRPGASSHLSPWVPSGSHPWAVTLEAGALSTELRNRGPLENTWWASEPRCLSRKNAARRAGLRLGLPAEPHVAGGTSMPSHRRY